MTRGLFGMLAGCVLAAAAAAAEYPAPREGNWVAHDFRFHTGEVLPEVTLHYTTVGSPQGEHVLMLHGTAGSGASMLTPAFAGELFGPGQPLDATRTHIILPDALGAGKSSKPSDGLKAKFPEYDYADMVLAQYRLLTEGLGIRHVRLVMGNSMGGMQTWLWGETYPDFMDALVPMAAQPTPMASRNWMLRRMLVETVRADPDYDNGNYTAQPRMLRFAKVFFDIATSGGTQAWQAMAPTSEKADTLVKERLAATFDADANDFVGQWASSRGYDAAPGLDKITAPLLAINAADDERNPPETGVMTAAMQKVANGKLYLIPASTETRGHGTTGAAKFYARQLQEFLEGAPRRGAGK